MSIQGSPAYQIGYSISMFESIIGHLGAAAMQRASSDDKIIALHIDSALARAHDGYRRCAAGEVMSEFKPIIQVGIDKYGEIDFRINMSIAALDRPKMDELCRMLPWTIKEALTLWLQHGPPSKEMAQSAPHTTDNRDFSTR